MERSCSVVLRPGRWRVWHAARERASDLAGTLTAPAQFAMSHLTFYLEPATRDLVAQSAALRPDDAGRFRLGGLRPGTYRDDLQRDADLVPPPEDAGVLFDTGKVVLTPGKVAHLALIVDTAGR